MQTRLPDAQAVGHLEKIGKLLENLAAELGVLCFLRIDRDPEEMANTVVRRPGGLKLSDLAEIIDEGLGILSVKIGRGDKLAE